MATRAATAGRRRKSGATAAATWSSRASSSTALTALTAVFGASTAYDAFAQQRVDRHQVAARLLDNTPRTVTSTGTSSDRTRAKVWCTDQNGAVRTGTVLVASGQGGGCHGRRVADGEGRLVTKPASASASTFEAAVLGVSAGFTSAGLACGNAHSSIGG